MQSHAHHHFRPFDRKLTCLPLPTPHSRLPTLPSSSSNAKRNQHRGCPTRIPHNQHPTSQSPPNLRVHFRQILYKPCNPFTLTNIIKYIPMIERHPPSPTP
ncbi:hypothetical protein BGX38DRAFT_1187795 [Terfezia claveryi]|nr:hypothetical protein BGX38DRAFT_1187795 [Terfezia claveryi]